MSAPTRALDVSKLPKGHRVMVQIQSTWFPLMDRNPQTYVENIFEAEERDFVKAVHRVHRGGDHASGVRVGVLGSAEPRSDVRRPPE